MRRVRGEHQQGHQHPGAGSGSRAPGAAGGGAEGGESGEQPTQSPWVLRKLDELYPWLHEKSKGEIHTNQCFDELSQLSMNCPVIVP